MALVVELLRINLEQWDLEDVTRRPDADDSVVADSKRAIDALNMARHGLVERIDAVVDALVPQQPTAPPATEGPAMVLDRLSVLAIRLAADPFDPSRGRSAPGPRAPDRPAGVRAWRCLLDDVRSGVRGSSPTATSSCTAGTVERLDPVPTPVEAEDQVPADEGGMGDPQRALARPPQAAVTVPWRGSTSRTAPSRPTAASARAERDDRHATGAPGGVGRERGRSTSTDPSPGSRPTKPPPARASQS